MLYPVRKTAKALGISDATLRIWGEKFADHLSDNANPGKGKTRYYTEGDLEVLNTISTLRDRGQDFDQIETALADGTRFEAAEPPTEDESPPASEQTALQTEAFTQTIAAFEARLNRWETKIDDLQDRLLDAEKRAARAEAELEILKQVTDQKITEEKKPNFWQRLFGGG